MSEGTIHGPQRGSVCRTPSAQTVHDVCGKTSKPWSGWGSTSAKNGSVWRCVVFTWHKRASALGESDLMYQIMLHRDHVESSWTRRFRAGPGASAMSGASMQASRSVNIYDGGGCWFVKGKGRAAPRLRARLLPRRTHLHRRQIWPGPGEKSFRKQCAQLDASGIERLYRVP